MCVNAVCRALLLMRESPFLEEKEPLSSEGGHRKKKIPVRTQLLPMEPLFAHI